MTPVRFGVIGCGCIGQEHIRNLLLMPPDTARLTVCVDTSPEMLAEAAELVPQDVHLCDSVEAIQPEWLDAVIVAVPNHLHAEVCERVSRRCSVHVLCEKPLATTMEDCERIARCVDPNKVCAVGLEYRHIPTMRRLVEALPEIGQLRMLTIREHRFPFLAKVDKWNRKDRNTGGTLVEKGCHFFDFFSLCCQGKKPTSVYARGGQAVNHKATADVADHALVVIDFEDIVCTLELCMFAEASKHQLEVSAVGDKGKIEAFAPAHGVKSQDLSTENFRIGLRKPRDWENARDAPDESHTRGAVTPEIVPLDEDLMAAGDHAGSTYYELLQFVDACRTGHSDNLASIADAALSVAIGLAATKSMRTNLPVQVADLLPDLFLGDDTSDDDTVFST
mmetsp:Transcript_5434/g.16433  ORF Transcript_5434/g.16433 Transcript_5434/m.16433 type:complete len:392 (+) Transcript_5434:57-1232(+)